VKHEIIQKYTYSCVALTKLDRRSYSSHCIPTSITSYGNFY